MAECHSTRAPALPPIDFNVQNGTEIAPGVTVECYGWGRRFLGTEASLIAAGIVTPDLLPGAPDQLKTIGRGTVGAHKIRVSRSTRKRLLVCADHTEAEKAAFRAWGAAKKRISQLPDNARKYRAEAVEAVGFVRRGLGAMLSGRGGFSFDDETVEQVASLLAEVAEVVERAPVRHSQAGRWAEEAKVRAEVLGDV